MDGYSLGGIMIYQIDFTYDLPEFSSLELPVDNDASREDVEELAYNEIKFLYPDVSNIQIERISEVSY
jgi:hypothetical protein